MSKALVMWVIYKKPKDYPKHFVARRWDVRTTAVPSKEVFLGGTLREVRNQLPPGLFLFQRNETDDPCIVETWL